MTKLTFPGAARTVTGSKYLLEVDGRKILIDCGLFQGLKELRLRNWEPLPVDPSDLSAVVLTHAHLDHTGYLPRLVADGYHGRVFCTPGTADLASWCCPTRRACRRRTRERRTGCITRSTIRRCRSIVSRTRFARCRNSAGELRQADFAHRGVDIEFINAGHLLGSAFIRMTIKGGPTILFGGDLGRYGRPVLPDPSPPPQADVLLLESTYGDRIHEPDDRGARLAAIIKDTVARGGKVIIPAFAIGRVEEVLYWIKKLEDDGTDSEAAGVSRQPDGDRRAALLRRPRGRARSGHPIGRGDPPVLHGAVSARLVGAAVVRSRAIEDPVDRRVVERHGDRRPCAVSPARRRCPTSAAPCCSSDIRRTAHAAGSSSTARAR